MQLLIFLWGIAKVMVSLFIGAWLLAWVLELIGFFDERCLTCEKKLRDPAQRVKTGHGVGDDEEIYCLPCYKARAGKQAELVAHCKSCQKEMAISCLIGTDNGWICEPCWIRRLWPKDWYRRHKV